MAKIVTLKNTGSEALAFAGIPLIQPNQTFEVTDEQAVILLKNTNIKAVESDKKSDKSFKGVEIE